MNSNCPSFASFSSVESRMLRSLRIADKPRNAEKEWVRVEASSQNGRTTVPKQSGVLIASAALRSLIFSQSTGSGSVGNA